jgi:V/A-type H+-transporting ATPase subunit E
MSLDKILEALEIEAKSQLAALEERGKTEIEQIRAQAQAEAEVVRQKRLAAIQAPLQAEQARILNKAKLGALQALLGTREDLIMDLFEVAAQRLAALPDLEDYGRLLRQLLQEAVEILGGTGPFRLEVRVQDLALMERIVQEMALEAVVEGNLKNEEVWGVELGGVTVTTPDGQISLVNTLEARLERAAHLYRTQIAEMLFEESYAFAPASEENSATPIVSSATKEG